MPVGRERENLAEKVDKKVDKEEKVDEKVDKEGNQPIPLDEPEPNINQLNTPHTEEDSTKVASNESGEDEDEVDWGIGTIDEHPKGVDKDGENVEGTTRKHPKEQRKIYPSTTDDTGLSSTPTPFTFPATSSY